jgi:hypothetical protein
MQSRIIVSLIFGALLASTLAAAQNRPDAEKPDPLFFAKIAANVAGNVQHDSLDNHLAIYISQENWADGLKDGDLGPFLKLRDAKPGRSAACVFSGNKDAAVCVYFDGKSPIGMAAVRAGSGGSIQPDDVLAAYKDISKDMLKKGGQEWHFIENPVNADDGASLPAFQITVRKP